MKEKKKKKHRHDIHTIQQYGNTSHSRNTPFPNQQNQKKIECITKTENIMPIHNQQQQQQQQQHTIISINHPIYVYIFIQFFNETAMKNRSK